MTENADRAVPSEARLDAVVTVGRNAMLYRIATFVYLHWVAWRVLFLGTQDISHRCSLSASNNAVRVK